MFYKVITKKICIVEADDIEEAKDNACNGDFLVESEKITSTSRITSSQKRRLEIQLMEDEDVF